MINNVSYCNSNSNQYSHQNVKNEVIPTTTNTSGQTSFGSLREINNTSIAKVKSHFSNPSEETSIINEITTDAKIGKIIPRCIDKNVRYFSRGNQFMIMTPATKESVPRLAFGIPDEKTGEIAKGREIEANYAPDSYLASIFGELEEKLKGLFPKKWN